MKRILKFMMVAVALGAVAYFVWNIVFPSGAWRYRMTVSVETPDGVKTGSSVREVYASTYVGLGSLESETFLRRGEAVTVDLGKYGVVFGLIKRGPIYADDYGWAVVARVFPFMDSATMRTTPEIIRYYSSLKNVKATLTPDLYPMFVAFGDLKDPSSVHKVTNWEAEFGPGVKIKSITIEMTDDPVTWDMKNGCRGCRSVKERRDILAGPPGIPIPMISQVFILMALNFLEGDFGKHERQIASQFGEHAGPRISVRASRSLVRGGLKTARPSDARCFQRCGAAQDRAPSSC